MLSSQYSVKLPLRKRKESQSLGLGLPHVVTYCDLVSSW